jgi:hypothetical protein
LTVVGGRLPPTLDAQAFLRGQRFEGSPRVDRPPHEQVGDAVRRSEEGGGNGQEYAGAIGRASIGRDRAPVHDARQAVEAGLDDLA